MKFTLSWLKDHLATDASLETIARTLTDVGLEVERIDDPSAKLKDFVIAAVLSAAPHPNADRLRVCSVDIGTGEPVQVVCGAPNARAGIKSVFAAPGSVVPGKNITLAKGVIRGVESNGMLCSAAELLLSDEHDGIIDLPADAPVGAGYAAWAGLADPVIDINLTPNRADAAGVAGIARDLAAAGLGQVRTPLVESIVGVFPCPTTVTLAFDAAEQHLCPLFALRLVRGVRNGPSPDWMQRRLRAIGLRPINALVDITNYLTFDRGRPLHVFDARKVVGGLTVRRARAGESLVALDGRTYALDESITVIADENGVESIAGIMGGEHTGCDEATTDVLIEAALWDPLDIARAGRKLGIRTDARYRFERGVDPQFCLPGADLAARMVLELCGGEASERIGVGHTPPALRSIAFPPGEVKRLTGLVIADEEIVAILGKLGFALCGSDPWEVTVPSWRPDIEGKADLVEEVVRIAGLARVTAVPLPRLEQVSEPVLTVQQRRVRAGRRVLAARGLVEAVTWSFISHAEATAFGGGSPALTLANPIAADLSNMRPSLLPGLLTAARRSAARGHGDAPLYEIGQVFRDDGETGQQMAAAAVRQGSARPGGAGRHWSRPMARVSVHDAKADALAFLGALGVPIAGMQAVAGGPAWFHPGRVGTLQFGPRTVIGHFGEIHPATLERLDVKEAVSGFEIVLDALPAAKPKPTKAKGRLDLAELMPVERDYAFIVEESVQAADILKAVRAAEKTLIADAFVFDVYVGPGVAAGHKSVGVAVILQPRDKTLTEPEIDAVGVRIVEEVAKRTGASLRA